MEKYVISVGKYLSQIYLFIYLLTLIRRILHSSMLE